MFLNIVRTSIIGSSCKPLFKNSLVCGYPTTRALSANVARKSSVIHAIPALRDNYMYVVIDYAKKLALAVDPVEPQKVLDLLDREKVLLNTVLTTHHHHDHCGGNVKIKQAVPFAEIYGGDHRIPAMTRNVSHGDIFEVGSYTVECLSTPCHTRGHFCYFVKENNGDPICFTGDTLFIAGCGRFFEGGAENMVNSLSILANLPHHTKIYCGHEYTVKNLQFATEVEPSNLAAAEKLSWAISKRGQYEPTVPSTIGDELKYNPFLRLREAEVQDFTKQTDPIKVMDALRSAKDNFRPT